MTEKLSSSGPVVRYVTVAMLASHAKKGKNTVTIALKRAGVKTEKIAGVRGLRITEKDANRFLLKQWPEVGPIPPLIHSRH